MWVPNPPQIGDTEPMGRLSIDVTDHEHRKLKALAALCGVSIKQLVLSRTIGDESVAPALAELERLLDSRMDRARSEGFSTRSVEEIFDEARRSVDRHEGSRRTPSR